jgi:hypothetical protein
VAVRASGSCANVAAYPCVSHCTAGPCRRFYSPSTPSILLHESLRTAATIAIRGGILATRRAFCVLRPQRFLLTPLPSFTALFTRLHALLPQGPVSAQPSSHDGNNSSPTAQSRQPTFLKVRIVTWNMHESLPKVFLRLLLCRVTDESTRPTRVTCKSSWVRCLSTPRTIDILRQISHL